MLLKTMHLNRSAFSRRNKRKVARSDFFIKIGTHINRCSSSFAKSHANVGYSVVNALITPLVCYQLFAICACGAMHLNRSAFSHRSGPRCNQKGRKLATFFSNAPLLLLFRKKSRSVCLFVCKRTHNGKLSLPTFCDFKSI